MDRQQHSEAVKALAYGKTPEEVADAEGVELAEVHEIADGEISDARADLKKGDFLNVD